MKILLTNDDGIEAYGLRVLAEELSRIGEVSLSAPEKNNSGAGHGMTVTEPLRAVRRDYVGISGPAWAINGTPVDCVKLAIDQLLPKKPDIVISGINNGRNLSSDCVYSGTVGAAAEGTLSYVPSIAVSLCGRDLVHYHTAAMVLKDVLADFLDDDRNLDYMLNINVPDLPYEQLKGFKASVFDSPIDYRRPITVETLDADTLLLSLDRPGPARQKHVRLAEGDAGAVSDGYVSLTPIWFDMVHKDCMENVRKLEKLFRNR